MEITIILLLVWLHFIGDFVLQTTYMATNKSSKNSALGLHVLMYAAPLVIIGVQFALVNMALHFVVDWCTSRVTKNLWNKVDKSSFFTVVGFDQAIHLTCLVLTYYYMEL